MKFLFVFCILITMALHGSAQSFPFTQQYAAAGLNAPSYTGYSEFTRVGMIQRRASSPIISVLYNMVSLEGYINKWSSGIGITYFQEKIAEGIYNTSNFGVNYAYKVRLSDKWYFRPGINYNYSSEFVDYIELVFSDQVEKVLSDGRIATTSRYELPDAVIAGGTGFSDFRASALVYNQKSHYCLVINHLARPNQSTDEQKTLTPYELTLMGDYEFVLDKSNEDLSRFAVNYALRTQAAMNTMNIGLDWRIPRITTGLGLHGFSLSKDFFKRPSPEYISGYIGFYTSGLTIGYNYDFALRNKISFHEVSLFFQFKMLFEDTEIPDEM